MLRSLLLLAPLFGAGCASAPLHPAYDDESAPTATTGFPQDWVGAWEGAVAWTAAGEPRDGFSMRLEIAPTEDPTRYAWTIVYSGAAGEDRREYSLVVRDAERAHYAIDEHNGFGGQDGIVLEAQLHGTTLHTWFELGGTWLSIRQERVGSGEQARILHELLSASGDPTTSGPERARVRSFLPTSQQRAELRRVER